MIVFYYQQKKCLQNRRVLTKNNIICKEKIIAKGQTIFYYGFISYLFVKKLFFAFLLAKIVVFFCVPF